MKTRKMICVIICCAMILVVTSSCTINQNEKYKVLIAGSSDASNGLYIPVDINEEYHKNTTRDNDLWPDEMVIHYDGEAYNCMFDQIIVINEKNGYRYKFDDKEANSKRYFILNDDYAIVSYTYLKPLSEEEKKEREIISESEAIAIAEQVFRKYFNVDYSEYEVTATVDESLPSYKTYNIYFKKAYDSQIELDDMLIVWVGFYGELFFFNGLSIGSITPPEEKPDAEEIRECIVERIKDVLKDNKIDYSDLTVDIKNMALGYHKKTNKYRVGSVLSFDCKGIVDGVEQNFHDLIEVCVVCN